MQNQELTTILSKMLAALEKERKAILEFDTEGLIEAEAEKNAIKDEMVQWLQLHPTLNSTDESSLDGCLAGLKKQVSERLTLNEKLLNHSIKMNHILLENLKRNLGINVLYNQKGHAVENHVKGQTIQRSF